MMPQSQKAPFGGPFWVSRCQEIEGDMKNRGGEKDTKKQKKTKCQDMKSTDILGGYLFSAFFLLQNWGDFLF